MGRSAMSKYRVTVEVIDAHEGDSPVKHVIPVDFSRLSIVGDVPGDNPGFSTSTAVDVNVASNDACKLLWAKLLEAGTMSQLLAQAAQPAPQREDKSQKPKIIQVGAVPKGVSDAIRKGPT